MATESTSTLTFTLAQVVGMLVMTLASLYWVAVDYPDWLPASWLAAVPPPALGTAAKWTLILAGSIVGWGLYQWGTMRKASLARARD